ncbi:MAG: Gfo/Idh/MocA family oxidoreductase, partial [Verrucomicrobiota bacterium]
MSERIGWGLVGPGRFAQEFVSELQTVTDAELVGVGSRKLERAERFAQEFGFQKAFGSYEELFADPAVQVVYLVVPHVFHRELAEQALRAGKAVLCEKPLTLSSADTEALIGVAQEEGRFLMEAMKTAFLPPVLRAKQWLEEGAIGEPVMARADFCFRGANDPKDRLLNPELGGGCLLDVGIYPLYLTRLLFGDVVTLQGTGTLASTG